MSKVCVLVGAGAGVGQAVAKKFLDEGYSVALLARTLPNLEALKKGLGIENVSTWPVDVSDSDLLFETIAKISKEVGSPEILIYNAYSAPPGVPSKLQATLLSNSFEVNIVSALVASQAVIPAMQQAGKGTIIFTGGGFALYPAAEFTALSIGKAALRALSNCLFQELKPAGIHAGTVTICGAVEPGSAFDPHKIADAFLDFHAQKPSEFTAEIVFQGK